MSRNNRSENKLVRYGTIAAVIIIAAIAFVYGNMSSPIGGSDSSYSQTASFEDVQSEVSGYDDQSDISGYDEQSEVSTVEEQSEAPVDESSSEAPQADPTVDSQREYTFANEKLLNDHFEKHNGDFGYADTQEYVDGANRVIHDENSLHKLEAEDGDDVYYLESTNEIVIVSTYGYIRTYFKPSSGIDYYNRQ